VTRKLTEGSLVIVRRFRQQQGISNFFPLRSIAYLLEYTLLEPGLDQDPRSLFLRISSRPSVSSPLRTVVSPSSPRSPATPSSPPRTRLPLPTAPRPPPASKMASHHPPPARLAREPLRFSTLRHCDFAHGSANRCHTQEHRREKRRDKHTDPSVLCDIGSTRVSPARPPSTATALMSARRPLPV
jgi:hypothetical protein